MVRSAEAAACTAGLPSDSGDHGQAEGSLHGEVDGGRRDRHDLRGPAASVTLAVMPRLATSAAGPPSDRSKVSVPVPVLVMVAWKVVPGAPALAFKETLTPLITTSDRTGGRRRKSKRRRGSRRHREQDRRRPSFPGAGVKVSVTSRKLLTPGGTSMVV